MFGMQLKERLRAALVLILGAVYAFTALPAAGAEYSGEVFTETFGTSQMEQYPISADYWNVGFTDANGSFLKKNTRQYKLITICDNLPIKTSPMDYYLAAISMPNTSYSVSFAYKGVGTLTLKSCVVLAENNMENFDITITGYCKGAPVPDASLNLTLKADMPATLSFNEEHWTGIDEFRIAQQGDMRGLYFFIDDIVAVKEPAAAETTAETTTATTAITSTTTAATATAETTAATSNTATATTVATSLTTINEQTTSTAAGETAYTEETNTPDTQDSIQETISEAIIPAASAQQTQATEIAPVTVNTPAEVLSTARSGEVFTQAGFTENTTASPIATESRQSGACVADTEEFEEAENPTTASKVAIMLPLLLCAGIMLAASKKGKQE